MGPYHLLFNREVENQVLVVHFLIMVLLMVRVKVMRLRTHSINCGDADGGGEAA